MTLNPNDDPSVKKKDVSDAHKPIESLFFFSVQYISAVRFPDMMRGRMLFGQTTKK